MALRNVVEVALHFESFRNVDLFHQGLYHLKTRLYRDEGDQRHMAIPYAYSTSPVIAEKPKPARTDHHNLIPAHIIEDQHTFSTRSFLIRYCEEEVELNDIGQFRVEVGIDDSELGSVLMLEVDLMFADLTQHGGADRFGEQPDVDSTEFKSVSTQLYRIHRFGQGLHECCPIVFDEFHFCLANLVVHTCLLDVRFRLRPNLAVPNKPVRKSSTGDSANDGDSPVVPTSQNGALSLLEAVYNNHSKASREDLMKVTEAFYHKHFAALAGSYFQLVEFFEDICSKCVTPAHMQALADIVDSPGAAPFDSIPVQAQSSTASGSTNGATKNGHAHGSLSSYLSSRIPANANAQVFAMQVSKDLSDASCQILKVWHRLLTVMSYVCREITTLLRRNWEERIGSSWEQSVIKSPVCGDVCAPEEGATSGASHEQLSRELRVSDKLKSSSSTNYLCIEDLSLKPDWESHPIMFEQRYRPRSSADSIPPSLPAPEDTIPSAPKRYRGVHLFVLVHGWQGNSFDMRLMKNNLALLFPDAIFLCATSNEDNTEGDMNESGIRLAQEVVNYICDWCPGSALGRLSFITFSCGGLIVRAALPLLHEYSSKMYTLIMFSCQHLGFLTENMSLVSTGLWGLKKWRKSRFLEQMSMSDASDPKETFIYRLSKTKGFEFFKWITLVSCFQDQFAPYESARAVNSRSSQGDKDIYASMVRNLWEPVKQESVFRFDVNFSIPEKNLDAVIGRAAHIRFLECQPIMKMIMHNYSFMFR